MSAAPDPAELAPSRDPAAYGRRPFAGVGFLAWTSLCLLCLFTGAAIGRFGVQLAPVARVEPGAIETPARDLARSSPPPPSPLQVPIAGTPIAAPADVTQLSDRVARLEAAKGRQNAAATAALAAAELSEAAQSSAPFGEDLSAYARLLPASPDLAALAPLAARGAPTRTALAAALPDLASLASAAARQPAKDASVLSRLATMIGRVVIIRRVDPRAPGVDGALTRAEAQASGGDLEAAVTSLDDLPTRARGPLEDWLAAARRRIEIDRRIESLRAQALASLLQPAEAQP